MINDAKFHNYKRFLFGIYFYLLQLVNNLMNICIHYYYYYYTFRRRICDNLPIFGITNWVRFFCTFVNWGWIKLLLWLPYFVNSFVMDLTLIFKKWVFVFFSLLWSQIFRFLYRINTYILFVNFYLSPFIQMQH